MQEINIMKIFSRPRIVAIVGDINTGKSMLLYHLLEEANRKAEFELYYYGLRLDFDKVKSQRVYSVAEIEGIKNSIIIIDELSSLFDLENRKNRRIIENTLRLINHNNNILILCGTPENFKKFISAKIDEIIYKKCTFADFINGSTIKSRIMSFNGSERGSEILDLPVYGAIYYNGQHYEKFGIPYLKEYDTKKDNQNILREKVPENVQ
jgi:hypothetical protein